MTNTLTVFEATAPVLYEEKTFPVAEEILRRMSQADARTLFENLDVAESSIEDYAYRLAAFQKFVSERGLNVNSYVAFKNTLRDKKDWSPVTKNKYLYAAKAALKALQQRGCIDADITAGVKGFSTKKGHTKMGVNADELDLVMIGLMELKPGAAADRTKAIFALLIFQGLRQVEIARLDVSDINLMAREAQIRGKGRDYKEPISLHPNACQYLKKYMESNGAKDGPLFFSNAYNSKGQRITTRSLRRIVVDFLKALEIEKSTHGFRHNFVTRLIAAFDGDLTKVMKFSRHMKVETVMIYNDDIEREKDIPTYEAAFSGVSF